MVNITKFAVKRPITIILCLITISFFGIQSLLGAKAELTPETGLLMLVISTVYAEAGPDDINEPITMKQEDAIASLDDVDTIQSCSRENVSVIMVQYEYGINIDTAYTNLKKAMDGIRNDLPDDASEPTTMELDLNAQPVVTLVVSGQVDGNLYTYVNNNVIPLFGKLGSVGKVSLSGGQKSYTRMELIPKKPEQYHLTISVVGQIVGVADLTIPVGGVKVGKQNLDVSVGNDYDNAESLKSVAIPPANGDAIHLSDIVEIYDALEDADSIGRYNGSDIISLGVKKQQSSTAIGVSRDVMKEIQEIKAVNPGIRIIVVNDSNEMITESISNVFQTMIMVVILSMIVLWLLYSDLRASVIVGTSTPTSIMLALISMSAMGSSSNVISLISLVLGVGMMVDNSINMPDDCFRAKEKHNSYDAVIEGSRTMINSTTGGTITTCAVFLPLAMLSGISGRLFKQSGYATALCIIASLFLAASIVSLCYCQWHPMGKENVPVNCPMKSLQARYRKNILSIIPRTRLITGISVLLLTATFLSVSRLDVNLMSSVDEGIIQVTVKTKPGLFIESVNETLTQVEDTIINDESVDHYLLTYGSSGLSAGGGGTTLNAYLKDDHKLFTDEVVDQWRRETEWYKDVSITMEQGSTTSSSAMSSSDQIKIDLQSTDYGALRMATDELTDALREREDVMQVYFSIENVAPVIKVEIDPAKAQAEGLAPTGIGSVIYNSLSGVDVSIVRINDEDVDIRTEYAPDRYGTIDKLQGMMITTAAGTTLLLENLGDVYYEDSPQQIERKNKQYQVAITMEPQADYKKTAEKNVKKFADSWELSVEVEPTANSMDETMGKELGALGGALGTGVFLILTIMAIQFESSKFSLMVITAIPFSLIGSFGLLFVAGSLISIVPMLGFLMFIGTAANNGIFYVETVNQLLAEMPLDQALVEAGAIRMRPIFTTTLTTIISTVPNMLAYGKAGAMMQGLAPVNVGGLIATTTLAPIMFLTYYKLIYNPNRKSLGLDEENISD